VKSVQEKIAGVVLAAGSSSRMGRAKQMLPYRGRPLLQHVLDSAADAAQLDLVILMVGYRGEEIVSCLNLDREEVRWVPDSRQGQSASIRRGVKEAENLGASAVLFLLGDQPLVPTWVIDRVAETYRQHHDPVVVPVCEGRRGNPVLMDRSLFFRLKEIRGDIGGRAILPSCEGMIRELEVSCPGIHVDVDDWDDYMRLPEEG